MIKEAFEKTIAAKTKTERYQAQNPVRDNIGELLLYAMEQGRVITLEHPISRGDIKRYLDLNKLKPAPSIKVKGPIEAAKNLAAPYGGPLSGIYFNKKDQEIAASEKHLLGIFPYAVNEERLIHYKTGEKLNERYPNYSGFKDESLLTKSRELNFKEVLKIAAALDKGNRSSLRQSKKGWIFTIGVNKINLDPQKVYLAIKGLVESGAKKIELKYNDESLPYVMFKGENGGKVILIGIINYDRTEGLTTYFI